MWAECVMAAVAAVDVRLADAGLDDLERHARLSGIVPDIEHGLDLRPGDAAKYIAKLGWELVGSQSKKGRASRTPWDLLADSKRGDAAAGDLWREWSKTMHGQRGLTWSRGLRPAEAVEDAVLAAHEEAPPVLAIAASDYEVARRSGLAWWLGAYLADDMPGAEAWMLEQGMAAPIQRTERRTPKEEPTELERAARRLWYREQLSARMATYGEARTLLWGSSRLRGPERTKAIRLQVAHEEFVKLKRGDWLPASVKKRENSTEYDYLDELSEMTHGEYVIGYI